MPKVLAVNVSEKRGVIKHPIEKGCFKADHGLAGDAHAGRCGRQVSLLGIESIDKIKESNVEGFCTRKFVENLTTVGIVLKELPVGTKIKAGEVLMEVTQVGKGCYLGCEIMQQIGECAIPGEVIFTRVLEDGWIKPGDEIVIEV